MMGFSPNMKKVLLIGIILLFSCDVTMLFAAPNDAVTQVSPASQGLTSSQTQQQLQAQVQAQIQALQARQGTDVPPPQLPGGPVSTTATPLSAPSSSGSATLPQSPFSQNQGLQTLNQQNFVPPPSTAPAQAMQQQAPGVPPGLTPEMAAAAAAAAASVNGNPSQNPSVVTQDDVNETAFNTMVQNALPMSPEQIQKLRSMYLASQFAAANTPNTPPRPTATSTFVDLSPGATPPVIRLSQGFVTSLVFVDSTGAAWPIESYDIGNPSAFNIQWDKTSNTLMVQSTVLYTYGNLAVKLRGLDTPVMITLIPGQKAVDYRVDLRIQGFGPNAKSFSGSSLPASTSSDLLNVLDGVPPTGSTNLTVEGGSCQAWLSGAKMYVRTRLSVLSPGWSATLSSADGMRAYEMQPAPMLLVSQNGQVVQLKVKGF